MNILSLIYSIPLPEHSQPSHYASSSISASTESTQPPSPSSTSPSTDSSDEARSQSLSLSSHDSHPELRGSSETARPADESDGMLAIGSALLVDDSTSSAGPSPRTPVGPSVHPYAASASQAVSPPLDSSHRMSVGPALPPPRPLTLRPRSSSSLPPPPPPPTSLPPPTPSIVEPPQEPTSSPSLRHLEPSIVSRQRGQSVTHKRTGSGSRLAALQEESERPEEYSTASTDTATSEVGDETARPRSRSTHRDLSRESHPLPPLPSPLPPATDTNTSSRPSTANSEVVPHSPQFIPRPRGSSTLSVRSEASAQGHPQLINSSTTMGTIFQRRNKTSAPPTSGTSSPTESIPGSIASMSRLTASPLPSSAAINLGRNRAISQPGRRPSTAVGTNPFPPLSAGLGPQNGTVPVSAGALGNRKPSIPSKLNPNPPQITINTALLSPPLPYPIAPLVPPPPIPYDNIPTAPTSPLPPMAPTDPLRKPYHMMSLLRKTMISKTGGYITRRLHVPQEVWSQGGAKLTNIPEKIRVVEVLCSALEEIHTWSVEYFGAGSVSAGMVLGIGSIGRKEGESWASKLEEFSSTCDGVVGNFGKKLGVGEGFATKKTSGVSLSEKIPAVGNPDLTHVLCR